MLCAGFSERVRPGDCCPTTSHPGRRSTSKADAGWQAASRPWSWTCAQCSASPPVGKASPVRWPWMDAPCSRVARAGRAVACDGYKRKRGSKVHMAVDTLGHLLTVHVTPANEQERAQVFELCEAVQVVTGHTVKLAWANQGYMGGATQAGRKDPWHRAAGDQAGRGEEGLRAVAQALGGRAQLCLGGALPAAGQALRAAARCAARTALPGLRHPHIAQGNSTADSQGKCITRYRLLR